MPPYSSDVGGGQANELIERYLKYVGRSLQPIQVSDGIYVTQVTDILLKDYIHVCSKVTKC